MVQNLRQWIPDISGYRPHVSQFLLAASVLVLSGIGVLLIGSANTAYQSRQVMGIVLGVALMMLFSIVDYRRILRAGWGIYGVALGLLLGVAVLGVVSGGAARWIELGPLRFQPSELTKILLILFFAWLFDSGQERMDQWPFIMSALMVLGIPVILILRQPDLSTAIVVVWIVCWMLFMAGLDYRLIGRALLVAVPGTAVFLFLITRPDQKILSDYQYRRIMAWLAPGEWAQDSYQQQNSMMAIGSGGLFGKGLSNDSPLSVKNGNFLPEPHTDFIMSVAGEELGFAGCLVILLLLALIVFLCIRTGACARSMKGRLICAGMAALIGGQAFVNLCVVTGLMPNTGLTLPFVSYGLTSLVSLYMGIGIVMNIGWNPEGRNT